MRIIVIGKGTIGGAVARALRAHHDVLVASRSSELQVDIESRASIRALFERVGPFDALVCAAGDAWLGPFAELDSSKLEFGLRSKLLGQLNLVLEGRSWTSDRGSFTLTSGFLSHVPVWGTAALGTVNGAIDSFVCHAAAELRPLRVNAVSPGAVSETIEQLNPRYSAALEPVSLSRVVHAYLRSVLGNESGQVLRAE